MNKGAALILWILILLVCASIDSNSGPSAQETRSSSLYTSLR